MFYTDTRSSELYIHLYYQHFSDVGKSWKWRTRGLGGNYFDIVLCLFFCDASNGSGHVHVLSVRFELALITFRQSSSMNREFPFTVVINTTNQGSNFTFFPTGRFSPVPIFSTSEIRFLLAINRNLIISSCQFHISYCNSE